MNRLGMMVDISHVADKTFFDAIATTKAPVIASHSSARALTNHPRNMTDDMLRAVAKNGGVVQVNFYSAFIDENYRKAADAQKKDARGGGRSPHRRTEGGGEAGHLSGQGSNRAGVGGQNSASAAEVADRSHRSHRQGRGSRSRRPGLGFRRRQRRHAGRHRLRRRPAQDHPGAARPRLQRGGHPQDSRRKSAAGLRAKWKE